MGHGRVVSRRLCGVVLVAWVAAALTPQAQALCSPGSGSPGAAAATPGLGAVPSGLGVIGPARAVDSALIDAAAGMPGPAAARTCQGGSGASPQSEPAMLTPTAPDRTAGNPFDPLTGAKHEHAVDVQWPRVDQFTPTDVRGQSALPLGSPASGAGLTMQFARHYQSHQDYSLSLGPGWSHSFDTRLARRRLERAPAADLPAAQLQVIQPDGRRIAMRPAARRDLADGATVIRYHGSEVSDGVIDERHDSSQIDWIWRWPSGHSLRFDTAGRLAEIVAPDLDRLTLYYDGESRLVRIADRHGRTLSLRYGAGRLVELGLPDGQVIRYVYDEARRLSAVRYPDGRLTRYHYEDPRSAHWLTGTSHPDGVRSRHRYDASGRVVESVGDETVPGSALLARYEHHGERHETWLTLAGQTTRYRWRTGQSGRASLLETQGPGCAICPATGPGALYDARGRLAEYGPWRLGYDSGDRIVSLSRDEGAGRAVWQMHYDGPDRLALPVRIEAPSVVAGHRRTLRLGYNDRGQLTDLIETGFAPYSDAVRSVGRRLRLVYAERGPQEGKLVAIERLALADQDLGPSDQAARSVRAVETADSAPHNSEVLARIDFGYDALRRLVSIGYPMGLTQQVSRDPLGRPVSERLADGTLLERRFDSAWQLVAKRAGPVSWQITRDRVGRLHEISWNPGMRLQFDAEHRVLSLSEYGQALVRLTLPRRPEADRGVIDPGLQAERARGESVRSSPAIEPAVLPLGAWVAGAMVRQLDNQARLTETRIDDLGRTIEEQSAQRGNRQVFFDALDRPVRWVLPRDATELRRYDAAGRLLERRVSQAQASEQTLFSWEGLALTGVTHTHGASRIARDAQGRTTLLSQQLGDRWVDFRFEYDESGRLRTRTLGDGLALAYRYDDKGRATGLDLLVPGRARPLALVEGVEWQGARAQRESLGAALRVARKWDEAGRLTELAWSQGVAQTPIARFAIGRNEQGLIESVARADGEDRFAFDGYGRLIVRERHQPGAPVLHAFQAYSAAGDLQWSRDESGRTHRWAEVAVDSLGRPLAHGPWQLRYGPTGRLAEMIAQPGHSAAPATVTHRYNAWGERVLKRVERAGSGAQETRFLYYQQALAAEADGSGRIRRHFIGWQGRMLALVDVKHDWRGRPLPSVYWLIGDHLGTPHAALDEAGRIVWRASYSVFGEALAESGRLDQPLRLPGQYRDRETGLHDNYRRTYDPRRGRYLEPDPLGLMGGWNLFTYAGGNPIQATDPLGLILFAFDGTGNSNPARAPDTLSTVAKFVSLYAGQARHYMSGVGTPDVRSGIQGSAIDAVDAASARRRVDHMLGVLDSALRSPETEGDAVDINVIGFSRGAAMARDFANSVASRIRSGHYLGLRRCVSLNFVGLWDTVAQFGLNGSANAQWTLGIPPEARVVVHAVAVNESRRFYPLESIGAQGRTQTGGLRLERGFVGDHGDIGGSHADGDLSDVALGWMVDQARAAGVRLNTLRDDWRIVSEPLLHDMRSVWQPGPERAWRVPGSSSAQARAELEKAAVLDRAQAESMVRRFPYALHGRDGSASLAGRVDMKAYSAWLSEQYGQTVQY
ncbi:MAG: phospholipase effector Tle1 domain-containing protein [Betaproteobacteria bacterium]